VPASLNAERGRGTKERGRGHWRLLSERRREKGRDPVQAAPHGGRRGVCAGNGVAGGVGLWSVADVQARRRRHPVSEVGDFHARGGWEERWWCMGCCWFGLSPQEQ
jgi:hypothetical protein